MGSPSSTAFSTFLDTVPSAAGVENHDYLPAWSRSTSNPPLLLPTSVDGTGMTGFGVPSSGLELFGGDLMGDVEMEGLQQAVKPGVGMGLSPLMQPTSMSALSMPLDLDLQKSAEAIDALLGGGSGSFNSAFKNYQPSPKQEQVDVRPSPSTRSLSLDSPAPLSFANVSALTSMSPVTSSSQRPSTASKPLPHIDASLVSPAFGSSKVGDSMAPPSFAEGLPSGLQRRATAGMTSEQDTTRIQAYAKLEFPSFDIYIQKLSVTIGRRPTAPPPAPAPADFLGGASQLAEYILGLGAPQVKAEPPSPLEMPSMESHNKGKGKAVEDVSVESPRFSPPLARNPPSTSNLPPTPLPSLSLETSAPPVASTSAIPVELTPIPTTPLEPPTSVTDVDLGPIRAVSRQHAKLSFDYDVGSWVLEVLGRNGVVVEGKWRAKGQRVLLHKKTKIQIAERIFHFVLPSVDAGPTQTRKSSSSRKRSTQLGEGKGKSRATELGDASPADERDPLLRATALAQASGSPALAHLPALPGFPPTASPAQTRSPSLSAPPHTLAPSPASLASPSLPPLPSDNHSNAPITRGSTRPRPPPSKPKIRSPAPPQPVEPPSEYALEIGRQRAAMIAHILAGQQGGTGKNALVKAAAAAAVAQRRAGGKGKGGGGAGGGSGGYAAVPSPAPAGKGPGKGKGLPPRPRRPSNVSWDDDNDEAQEAKGVAAGANSGDDDDSSSSSSSSDDSDDDGDDADAVGGANMAGGMKSLQKTPQAAPPSAAPSPLPTSTTALADPSPVPVPRKQPAKQPKRKSSGSNAVVPQKTPVAPPAPPPLLPTQPTPSLLPGLPFVLPALPGGLPPLPLPRPAGSPALSASAKLKGRTTPLLPSSSLPSILPPTSTRSPAPRPAALPSSSAATSFGGILLPGAGTRPSPAPSTSAPPPLPAKKPKAAKKATAGKGKSVKAAAAAATAASATVGGGEDGANAGKGPAAKARPSPYTPAPLLAGAPLPDAAPANDLMAKPPYTYASLIAQAVQSAPGKRQSLQGIYDWVVEKWPYFRDNQSGWQNTIRHNLTPQRGFVKFVRPADDPSKTTLWLIDPVQLANFDGHHFRVKKAVEAAAGGKATTAKTASPSLSTASPGPPPPSIGVGALASSSINGAARSSAGSPSTATSSRPSPSPGPSIPAVAPNPAFSRPVPIVVGPVPKNYVKPPPVIPKGGAAEGFLTKLLDNPPIIFHDESLILNPTIFGHLTTEQLANLQAMTANDALRILQPYVLQHFTKTAAAAKASQLSAAGTVKAAAGALGQSPSHGLQLPSRPAASPAPPASNLKKPTPSTSTAAGTATTTGSTKRGREADIDLTASMSGPAPKLAKTTGRKK